MWLAYFFGNIICCKYFTVYFGSRRKTARWLMTKECVFASVWQYVNSRKGLYKSATACSAWYFDFTQVKEQLRTLYQAVTTRRLNEGGRRTIYICNLIDGCESEYNSELILLFVIFNLRVDYFLNAMNIVVMNNPTSNMQVSVCWIFTSIVVDL